MYPSQWLTDNFKHSIRDLKNTVTMDSYDSAMAQLASGQIDVMPEYADARLDEATKWTTTFGAKGSIWDDTNVIGVTPAIANDGIMVSEKSKIMTPEFKKALPKICPKLPKVRKLLRFIHMMAMLIQQKMTIKQPLKWQMK